MADSSESLIGYSGARSYKGLIGKPVGFERPQWIQDIIDFRNEKYQEEGQNRPFQPFQDIDKKYDKIDSVF